MQRGHHANGHGVRTTNDHPRRMQHPVEGPPLLEELGVDDERRRRAGIAQETLQLPSRAGGNRRLDDDRRLATGDRCQCGLNRREVHGAVGSLGGGDGDEHGISTDGRLCISVVECDVPIAHGVGDQIADARLSDREAALDERRDPGRIDIGHPHGMAQMQQAGGGGQAYVARADDGQGGGAWTILIIGGHCVRR